MKKIILFIIILNILSLAQINSGYFRVSNNQVNVTYNQLVSLINSSALETGKWYCITDYQTIYIIPGTTDTGKCAIEPLVVQAIDNNKISPVAFSKTYPEDVIYYDYQNNQDMVTGCTKGYIYRRIDTKKNNDIGFDYRNVKFRRWQITATEWNSSTVYTYMSVVKNPSNNDIYISIADNNENNPLSNIMKWRRFEWQVGNYVSPTPTEWIISNFQENYPLTIPTTTAYRDTLMFACNNYTSIYNNLIKQSYINIVSANNSVIYGNNFSFNSIGNGFSSNSIGNDFSSNSIGNYFYSNSIGNDFSFNSTGNGFHSNSIGNDFSSNSIGNDFSFNSIGNYFYSNSIGNGFNSNSIGNYFYSNSIGNDFSFNSIGNYFYSNSIGNGFSFNSIGNYFSSNSIGNYFYSNSIGNYFYYNKILTEISSVNFLNATHVYQSYNKEWFTTYGGDNKLIYIDAMGSVTVANITD